jgi:hypothetical protein
MQLQRNSGSCNLFSRLDCSTTIPAAQHKPTENPAFCLLAAASPLYPLDGVNVDAWPAIASWSILG